MHLRSREHRPNFVNGVRLNWFNLNRGGLCRAAGEVIRAEHRRVLVARGSPPMASPSRLVARTRRPGAAPWSFEFNRGEDGDKFKLDETLNSDAMLLGRVSYEGFAGAWPKRSGVLRQVP